MKGFGTLAGLFFLGLIGLMFYWLYWDEDSKIHIADVKKQLTILESFWNRQSGIKDGKLRIGYSDVVASGFPFGMRVRLLKPYLRDTRTNDVFTLTTSYIDIIPDNLEAQHFTIVYPAEGRAHIERGQTKKSFYLYLSNLPELYAQKVMVGNKAPGAVNQYGVRFPPTMVLQIEENDKLRSVPFRPRATEEVMYRPLVRNMRERIGWLKQLLESKGRL